MTKRKKGARYMPGGTIGWWKNNRGLDKLEEDKVARAVRKAERRGQRAGFADANEYCARKAYGERMGIDVDDEPPTRSARLRMEGVLGRTRLEARRRAVGMTRKHLAKASRVPIQPWQIARVEDSVPGFDLTKEQWVSLAEILGVAVEELQGDLAVGMMFASSLESYRGPDSVET
jgi:hypothetical protein